MVGFPLPRVIYFIKIKKCSYYFASCTEHEAAGVFSTFGQVKVKKKPALRVVTLNKDYYFCCNNIDL
jgi:hypothetical protein